MRWRFARRPLWILSHLLVVALVVTMVSFGFWQLRRFDDRQAANALIEERAELPPSDVTAVVPIDDGLDGDRNAAVDGVLHRRVVATGTYVHDDTVLVDNRSFNGAPGGWVLTPLVLEDGTAIVVNRGFIGFTRAGELVAPPPPEGTVTVEGTVQPSQQRGRFGATDPDEGRLDVLARADVGRIAAQVRYEVRPAYVQLISSVPAQAPPAPDQPALLPLPPPDLTDGPHLSYAVQWFIFATIGLIGYPLVLRRVARQQGVDQPGTRPGGGQDGGQDGDGSGGPGPDRGRSGGGTGGADGARAGQADGLDRELRDLLSADGG